MRASSAELRRFLLNKYYSNINSQLSHINTFYMLLRNFTFKRITEYRGADTDKNFTIQK